MNKIRSTFASFSAFAILFGLFGIITGPISLASSSIEVAESIPIETNLAVPGIRSTQEVWLEMINSAQSSIDLEQFYVSNQPNQALDPVLAALRSAAARGVKIRFVLDSKFYGTYPDDANQLNQVPGIQVKTIDFSPLGGIQHSKYFVVDRTQSFVGSANFDWLALTHIHEVGLKVIDPRIGANLESVFENDWTASSPLDGGQGLPGSRPLEALGSLFPQLSSAVSDSAIELFASPASRNPSGIPDTLDALVALMGSAQTSLRIQVYEYTTRIYHSSSRWKALDEAIRQAAARGVNVELLVDAKALTAGRADLNALSRLDHVQIHVVRIPQWSGGPIPFARVAHSKYAIVDGSAAWVGSENWSEGYFMGSRNVGCIVHDTATTDQLDRIFTEVWNSPYASML